jgi:hypothetical protein
MEGGGRAVVRGVPVVAPLLRLGKARVAAAQISPDGSQLALLVQYPRDGGPVTSVSVEQRESTILASATYSRCLGECGMLVGVDQQVLYVTLPAPITQLSAVRVVDDGAPVPLEEWIP